MGYLKFVEFIPINKKYHKYLTIPFGRGGHIVPEKIGCLSLNDDRSEANHQESRLGEQKLPRNKILLMVVTMILMMMMMMTTMRLRSFITPDESEKEGCTENSRDS